MHVALLYCSSLEKEPYNSGELYQFRFKKMSNRVRNLNKPNMCCKRVATGRPPPNFSVISNSELSRVYDIVEDSAARKVEYAQQRKQQLRDVSDARVEHWPNTIEALRLTKERQAKARFADEEARRKIIDREVTEFEKTQKERAIEKANLQLHQRSDRIKTFSSKLFLASVLDERERQIEIKQHLEQQQKEVENKWSRLINKDLELAKKEEELKAQEAYRKRMEVKRVQEEQLAQIRATKMAARDRNRDEGQQIRRAAEEQAEEEKQQELQRKEEQRIRGLQLNNTRVVLQQMRKDQEESEQREEEAILEFAKKKQAQTALRQQRLDEKQRLAHERRQNIIDKQAAVLASIKAVTEEREMKAMINFDAIRAADEEARKEAVKNRQREIDAFTQDQLRRKKEQKDQESMEEAMARQAMSEHAERMLEEEIENKRQQRAKAQQNQRLLMMQAHEKKMQESYAKRADVEESIAIQDQLRREQSMYEDYVNSVMHDYIQRGRNSDLVTSADKRTKLLHRDIDKLIETKMIPLETTSKD